MAQALAEVRSDTDQLEETNELQQPAESEDDYADDTFNTTKQSAVQEAADQSRVEEDANLPVEGSANSPIEEVGQSPVEDAEDAEEGDALRPAEEVDGLWHAGESEDEVSEGE